MSGTSEAATLQGLVLAGGFSRRMGRDKAALQIHELPQAEHVATLLSGLCESVAISVRPDQRNLAARPWYTIPDNDPGSGPLGAIVSAQAFAPGVAWLAVACDLPFVTEEVLAYLVAHRDPTRLATCYSSEHDGLPEPCCTIYEPRGADLIRESFARDMRCPRKVLIDGDVLELEQIFPGALDNINTPTELEAAMERLRTPVA